MQLADTHSRCLASMEALVVPLERGVVLLLAPVNAEPSAHRYPGHDVSLSTDNTMRDRHATAPAGRVYKETADDATTRSSCLVASVACLKNVSMMS